MIGAFKKVGLCPFTRARLQDENVRHDNFVHVDGDDDDGEDTEASFYFDVKNRNHSA
jgi:hypothetical protein